MSSSSATCRNGPVISFCEEHPISPSLSFNKMQGFASGIDTTNFLYMVPMGPVGMLYDELDGSMKQRTHSDMQKRILAAASKRKKWVS